MNIISLGLGKSPAHGHVTTRRAKTQQRKADDQVRKVVPRKDRKNTRQADLH